MKYNVMIFVKHVLDSKMPYQKPSIAWYLNDAHRLLERREWS